MTVEDQNQAECHMGNAHTKEYLMIYRALNSQAQAIEAWEELLWRLDGSSLNAGSSRQGIKIYHPCRWSKWTHQTKTQQGKESPEQCHHTPGWYIGKTQHIQEKCGEMLHHEWQHTSNSLLTKCNVFTLLLKFSQFTNRTGTRYINQWCSEWQVWGL